MLKIGNKAFTLIEVMIAAAILVIGIVGVLRAYTASISAFEASRSGLDAASLLKTKMADIEKGMAEKMKLLPGTYEGTFEGADEALKWKLCVRTLDLPEEEMKNCLNVLELTVLDGRANPPRSFSLATYVNNYETKGK